MGNDVGSDPSDLEPVLSVDWDAVEADLEREIDEDHRSDDGRARSDEGQSGVGEGSV